MIDTYLPQFVCYIFWLTGLSVSRTSNVDWVDNDDKRFEGVRRKVVVA